MLTRVTITGADDRTDILTLAELSEEFPFVEWAVLSSPKRTGTARYPTSKWWKRLDWEVLHGARHMKLAAHLCGQDARDVLNGVHGPLPNPEVFQRIQLNGFATYGTSPEFIANANLYDFEFILQCPTSEALEEAERIALVESVYPSEMKPFGGYSALYDPSGGRGEEATVWPLPPQGINVGYAGGIKPSNVEDVLTSLADMFSLADLEHVQYWVDMESGVRTNDVLDLSLVRTVLEKAKPFVKENFR